MSAGVLPPLREDLQLLPGSPDEEGAPRWLLFDAMRNRYFALSQGGLELVQNWRAGVASSEFSKQLSAAGHEISQAEIDAFVGFLSGNHLVQARSKEASADVYASHVSTLLGFWRWLLHNYLFIRIPLLRPDRLLARWAPRLTWLFSDFMHYTVVTLGLLGLIMVMQQWNAFLGTFQHFFNFQGLLLYAITLSLVKTAHELGHAFVAHRQGCHVASMGVAFLVMFPVLYTDTTDAWRLRSRRDRLRIVTAGVRAELYLALLATFLWNVLPDGATRSAAFFVATTSWVTSVLINVSPFMRFDGYYALSDLLGIENLQTRAFAVGRWQLRRLLWGFSDPLPEPMPRSRLRLLTVVAWSTWVYRFLLFLGIALLVYHLFFKVLGLILFVVEVLWFVLLPVIRETRVWWQRRESMDWSWKRVLFWMGVGAVFVWVIVPRSSSVAVPAVLLAEQDHRVFAPEPAQVVKVWVREGQSVAAGDVMLTLSSDELDYELGHVEEALSETQMRLDRVATSPREKVQKAVLEQERLRLQRHLRGLLERREKLAVHAPFDGVAVRVEHLQPGTWVDDERALIQLIGNAGFRIEGFVSEQNLPLLAAGQRGQFVADNGLSRSLETVLQAVDVGAVFDLPYPELASPYGGSIAARAKEDGLLLPTSAQFRVQFSVPVISQLPLHRLPGVVQVQSRHRSLVWHEIKLLISRLIRESGF